MTRFVLEKYDFMQLLAYAPKLILRAASRCNGSIESWDFEEAVGSEGFALMTGFWGVCS